MAFFATCVNLRGNLRVYLAIQSKVSTQVQLQPGLKPNKKSEGSENVTGLKFANRTRILNLVFVVQSKGL